METQNWERVEGMIIAATLDPEEVSNYLQQREIVAQLDWFAETSHMMGIRVVTDGEHIGVLRPGKTEVEAGEKLADFVEGLADKFSAEVMVADLGIDKLPEGGAELPEVPEVEETPLLVVEISETPASAVPLMAAFNGVDIVDFELGDGKRALVAQLPAGRSNWTLGDVPLVTLTSTGRDFQAFLIEDEDPEDIITYNWGMEERIIPGAADDAAGKALAQELVGPDEDILAIHSAVPGVSEDMALTAAGQRGDQAIGSFVRSLGLPPAVADFLSGKVALDTIGGNLHQARGVSNAIGRSVDIMIGERTGEVSFWDTYTKTVVDKPWLVPLAASAEATVALALLVASRSRGGKRSGVRKLGTAVGILMLIDSVGEVSLAKFVRLRDQQKVAE